MADTIYKQMRKERDLTRDEVCDRASEMNNPIQPERLERIENAKFPIAPDEVMLLAEIYGEPTLCNHYCSKECPIGEKYVPEIKVKDLAQIVLEMLSSLNSMKKNHERLIEITADGIIEDDQIGTLDEPQFHRICEEAIETAKQLSNELTEKLDIEIEKSKEVKA